MCQGHQKVVISIREERMNKGSTMEGGKKVKADPLKHPFKLHVERAT